MEGAPAGQVSGGGPLGSPSDPVRYGRSPCPLGVGDPKETGAVRSSSAPAPREGPVILRPCRRGGPEGPGGLGRPANARILPQAGVHLALVGPGLSVAPVFLIHELVLVVLIHVHLPEPGRRHRILRHPGSGAVAKASSWCCLSLGEPSSAGTRSLVPSLPSSALGRRRQPGLGRFWACALAALLPPQVHTQLKPPTRSLLSSRERAQSRERARFSAQAQTFRRKGAGRS